MQRGGFLQKKCPRCGGNVFLDRDEYGWLEQCLQCSYSSVLGKLVETKDIISGKNCTGQAKELARTKK